MTPLRIVVLVEQFPKISEAFVLRKVSALVEMGHHVVVAAVAAPDEPRHETWSQVEAQVSYLPEVGRGWRRFPSGLGLFSKLAARSPSAALRWVVGSRKGGLLRWAVELSHLGSFDVVHCHFGPLGLRALELLDLGVIRGHVVTSFHGYDINVLPRQRGLDMYGELFRRGSAFTVGSHFMKDRVVALGCPQGRVHVLPQGLDVEKWPFRARHGVMGHPIRIVTVGRLVEAKGVAAGLEAIAKLAETYDLHYTVAGDGPLRPELETLARQLGLEDRVEFRGWATERQVKQLFYDSDLFLLPAASTATGDEEGQGLVVQEAQATGLPVVVPPVGGLPEGLKLGQSGVVARSAEPTDLAEALVELLESPGRWAAMSEEGRRFAWSFDIHSLTARLVRDVYRMGGEASRDR